MAGVTINLLFSDTGLFGKAQEAKNTWENAENSDREAIGELANQVNDILNGTWTGGENPPDEGDTVIESDGSYSELKGVNTPDLADGLLTPIVWDETANAGEGGWKKTAGDDKNWYNYTTTQKQWANAVIGGTFDESGILNEGATGYAMFVWIPRFAYQISDNYHTNSTIGGTINIKFMKETGYESADGEKTQASDWDNASGQGNWNIHPAFEYNGTKAGIWVAKFEASQSDAGANAADYQNHTGGTSGMLTIRPGVNSWRNITIGEMFEICRDYNSNLNSHMMKNSEWGAVAYLTQSNYGKNSEIWINPNSNYITGQAGEDVNAEETTDTYDYSNIQYGVQASTTGTVYGIYDISGCSGEYVAAYVNNGNNSLTACGSSIVNINTPSYMKDMYNVGSGDTREENYVINSSVYGDAVYETSSDGKFYNSWYGDNSGFPCSNAPFFYRGGNSGGIFYFDIVNGGNSNSISFRPVLIAP